MPTRDIVIRAREVIPWGGADECHLPALTLEVTTTGTTCLLGRNSQHLGEYLRVIGGVDDYCSGELEILGQPFKKLDQQQWRHMRRNIGFVTRTAPLLSVLNGMENIVLPALYHKLMNRDEAEASARILLAGLNCHADLTLLPAYLSPLERTQMAIARAAIMQPDMLLLEEPYHELEVNEHNAINEFLAKWATNHALIVSTRNLHFVKQQADKIVFAGESKILYFEEWQAFYESRDAGVMQYLQQYRDNYSI